MQSAELDQALLAAHDAGNKRALIALYTQASELAADPQAAAFFLTQAYVFALECGVPEAAILKTRLVAMRAEAA